MRTCSRSCAYFDEILPKALLTGPAALLELGAVLLRLLVLASFLVEARSVCVSTATCLIGEIDWSALVQSIRNIRENHWGSVELAAAGIDIAPSLGTPLRCIWLQAIRMASAIPSLAGAPCLSWKANGLLSNQGIHSTLATVNANAAAVTHAPSEAMEFLSALSKDLLAQALAT